MEENEYLNAEELATAIKRYRVVAISDNNDSYVHAAILAAMGEAESYLSMRYDTAAIFAARGEERNYTLLEHIKAMAIWYLCRRANVDVIYTQVKDLRDAAIDYLEKIAGISTKGKALSPDLPVKTDSTGVVKTSYRMGSNRKFAHTFDD